MVWLVLGVLLWSIVHLSRCLAPGFRARMIERLGEKKYKGLVALDIVIAIVLIVIGWRSTTPEYLYVPPGWGRTAATPLMLIALILFAAASLPTNIKRVLRHPQLTGVVVWAVAHLLANGEDRSLVLFGGLGLWALIEIVLISRREGPWQRPEPVPLKAELKPLIGGIVVYVVLLLLHPYLFGVPVMLR